MADHNTAMLPGGAIVLRGHRGIVLRCAGPCAANLGESYADIGGSLAPPFCAGWPGQDWTRPPKSASCVKSFHLHSWPRRFQSQVPRASAARKSAFISPRRAANPWAKSSPADVGSAAGCRSMGRERTCRGDIASAGRSPSDRLRKQRNRCSSAVFLLSRIS